MILERRQWLGRLNAKMPVSMHASRQARGRDVVSSARLLIPDQAERFSSATRCGIQNSLIATTMGGMS